MPEGHSRRVYVNTTEPARWKDCIRPRRGRIRSGWPGLQRAGERRRGGAEPGERRIRRAGLGTAAITLRRKVLTDSDVGNTSAVPPSIACPGPTAATAIACAPMHALWLEAQHVRVRGDAPDPSAAEAAVRVALAGVCNTDLEMVRGYYPFTGVPGHEFVGVVERADDAPEWVGTARRGRDQRGLRDVRRLPGRTQEPLRAPDRARTHRTQRDVRGEAVAADREPARDSRPRPRRGRRLHGAAGGRAARARSRPPEGPRARRRRRQARAPGRARDRDGRLRSPRRDARAARAADPGGEGHRDDRVRRRRGRRPPTSSSSARARRAGWRSRGRRSGRRARSS